MSINLYDDVFKSARSVAIDLADLDISIYRLMGVFESLENSSDSSKNKKKIFKDILG